MVVEIESWWRTTVSEREKIAVECDEWVEQQAQRGSALLTLLLLFLYLCLSTLRVLPVQFPKEARVWGSGSKV